MSLPGTLLLSRSDQNFRGIMFVLVSKCLSLSASVKHFTPHDLPVLTSIIFHRILVAGPSLSDICPSVLHETLASC